MQAAINALQQQLDPQANDVSPVRPMSDLALPLLAFDVLGPGPCLSPP